MEFLLNEQAENDEEKNKLHQEILKVYLSGNQIMEAAEYSREKIGHSQLSLTLVIYFIIVACFSQFIIFFVLNFFQSNTF